MAIAVTSRFWHPFADMGAVSRSELVIERGEGVYVFDAEGNRYLDATASLWYQNLGYGREEIADAVSAQMRKLAAYSTFGDFGTRRRASSPRGCPSTRRWRTRRSSSAPAAATRSTPRPRSLAGTGCSRAGPSACT
jgi:hypothetical protein